MLPDHTPAVARALQTAHQQARSCEAEVQPVHLLAGLLDESEGHAALRLAQLGVSLAEVRQKLGQPGTSASPAEQPLPLSAASEKAFVLARQRAADAGAELIVTSEHLLLALLRVDDDLVKNLESHGLDRVRLEAEWKATALAVHLDEPLDLTGPTEQVDVARILDASANRAREAIRVVEDYCRFVLDDAFLSSRLKQLRHDLTESLARLPSRLLLEARETQRDIGTAISTAQESERHSLLHVAQANLKRLQEALRTLEEFGKLQSAELGRDLERLRYASYTLERAILLGSSARERLVGARLYVLLTAAHCTAALDWTIREAAVGGANVFQLREKNLDDRTFLERARNLRRWTHETGTLFIVNDRPDIARLVEADGVHLGQDDLPVKETRRIVGPDMLIGVSTHNIDQLRQAILDGASYLGIGPTFPSGTKQFETFAGLEYVRQATAETTLPAFVIGGVSIANIAEAAAAGARRVAVSQAICQADEPRHAASALRAALK
jgi:thiamine-phosphate pyrophosphorylase